MSIRPLLIPLLGLALSLATPLALAAELQPLRVANQKSSLKLLLEAAGELDRLPYRIDWSEFAAAAPLGEALNAGAVDVGALGDAPYVFALGAGAPLKVVAITHADGRFSTSILVPRDSPLRSVADLEGKRVVTNRGSIGHYLVIRALQDAGLKSTDVTLVNLLPSDARSALESGNADAWSTWDPYTTIAITQNGARILRKGDDLLSNHLYLAATSQAIAGKRAQLDDFVQRLDRAWQWVNEHPEAYARAQAKVTGLPVQVHLTSASNTDFRPVAISTQVIDNLQKTADIYLAEGVLTRPVDVSQGFDDSFNAVRGLPASQPTHSQPE
ncbi:ABC transporter substrate-binding protein [Stutzerimonas kirkiae]|uniref:ABC transporter substrate-binding protein n=1 Tax=Stutzerimonas kirkiae TaxID=2211392 RepID=UPI0010383F4F|nr:ABC transporter substrate-binding protein [Stutzerimonas kirkiae]TBV04187.1 aliphatic sulfonates ABC transporter substrate-binding protein [Stutzerimonas kirkiae]